MTADPPAGLESVAASADDVQDAPDLRGGAAFDPGGAYDQVTLGADCPITPLGFLKQKFYFLDFAGQMIELGSEFRKGELMALFGTQMAWLTERWPQWKKTGEEKTGETGSDGKPIMRPIFEADGFSQKLAQEGLIMACSKRRLFDPKGKVRGRGAHRGAGGEIVMHCGDALLVGGRRGTRDRAIKSAWFKPGELAGFVYPTGPTLTHPADSAAPVNIAHEVLAKLETWTWKRAEIDPYLLLCWLIAACSGGALRVRPHGWITGPSGAGKTTLQKFLQELMGDWGVFTEDATEAGVRQLLDQDTLAVMFDEIEAEEDNQAVVMKIVRLARLAYSGASSVRGSTDHKAKEFTARSCFLFSSIHHHELPAQDRNRIAILHLAKFPPKTERFNLPDTVKQWGDALRRRIVEQWHRFDATIAAYQQEMLRQGYTGREQDTYGTLLACGDLVMHEEAPPAAEIATMNGGRDRVADWVKKLAGVLDSVRAEAEDTAERCLKHLASFRLPAAPGHNQETVARWIQRRIIEIVNKSDRHAARDKLLAHGISLVHLTEKHDQGNGQGGLKDAYLTSRENSPQIWVAVANKTNLGVAEIFDKSMWKGGVWTQSLRLVEGAIGNKKRRFGGPPEGCILVPLTEIIDLAAAIEEAEALSAQGELGDGR